MNNDNLHNLFNELNEHFDFAEPQKGHEERFLQKLNTGKSYGTNRVKRTWVTYLAIAASVALLITAGLSTFIHNDDTLDTAAPSEVVQAEFYFTAQIEQQLEQIKAEATPETQVLVADAIKSLQKLQADYKKLEQDLANGGNPQLLLNAMITNFQTRINLLQDVLENIKQVKQLKSVTDENNNV